MLSNQFILERTQINYSGLKSCLQGYIYIYDRVNLCSNNSTHLSYNTMQHSVMALSLAGLTHIYN